MFQYAAGKHLAMLRHTQLQLDISWYDRAKQDDGVNKRRYELEPYALTATLYRPTFANKLLLKAFGHGIYSDDDQPYVFHEEVLELPNFTRLFGFFQNERYFAPIRDTIMQEFSLTTDPDQANQQLLDQINANDQPVSVHVRRGDYVTSAAHAAHHGSTTLDYYKKASQTITKTVPKPTFYVFSDDPAWCKQHLKLDGQTIYVDNANPGSEDMRLMRACHHNIIANSSFSWWGAWLNTNPKKVVVGPKQWLNSSSMDTSSALPADWIRL
jgi:hypothetical protein